MMRCYELFELTFRGDVPADSQAEIDLQAEFAMDSAAIHVKGFYAGEGLYKIRFLPRKEGTYHFRVSGIFTEEGELHCEANPEGRHMVSASGTHFCCEDGSRFLPFGTTIYALAHQEESLIEETMQSLAAAPFNKVRFCVFPKHYDYNHNEPAFFPFEKDEAGKWDVHRPCFAYWNHLENVIFRLAGMGIQSDLILFHPYDRWGFPFLSREESLVYLSYTLRRLAAIPQLWWSLANEYDFVFCKTLDDWYAFENFIAAEDPYHHLLSNHNGMRLYDFERPNITHCSVQTNALYKAGEWQQQYHKPVIYDECCYEGNIQHEWGSISGFEMANRFWCAYVQGAYATHGETFYSEDEVLWWSKGGKLKGESPQRIAYLRKFMEELPGDLEPWEEPVYSLYENPTEDKTEAVPPFAALMNSLDLPTKERLKMKNGSYCGHIGEQVYIKYLGHMCSAISFLFLPENHTYRIDAVDIWTMERTTIAAKASGYTTFALPGKEGIVLAAVQTDNETQKN